MNHTTSIHVQRALRRGNTTQLGIVQPLTPVTGLAWQPKKRRPMNQDPCPGARSSTTAQPLQSLQSPHLDAAERLRLRVLALSRWENEGGAGAGIGPAGPVAGGAPVDDPTSAATEAVQLRIRVIALENLVIALLAQAPEAQLELAREMALYISPRPGFTPHQLTLRAADEMRSLVDRARPFRAMSAR